MRPKRDRRRWIWAPCTPNPCGIESCGSALSRYDPRGSRRAQRARLCQRPRSTGSGGHLSVDAIASFFKFRARWTDIGTEARAGLTTFMVMAYIIFVNGSILTSGFAANHQTDPHFTTVTLAAGTALVAGIFTILMGVVGTYPFARAAGLGINAIVAFSLTGRGLSPGGAMGVIVLEGLAVTILV